MPSWRLSQLPPPPLRPPITTWPPDKAEASKTKGKELWVITAFYLPRSKAKENIALHITVSHIEPRTKAYKEWLAFLPCQRMAVCYEESPRIPRPWFTSLVSQPTPLAD
jgi:hypothetical protein